MKLFFLSAMLLASAATFAQPKVLTQATVYTTTNVVAPEDEDVSQIGNQGGGMRMNFMDGETKSVTYLKNDLTKTNYKSEMGKGSVYRNNSSKVTTMIFEMMGNKQGFYVSDDDQAQLKMKRDSLEKERAKTDTGVQRRTRTVDANVTVVYTDEAKKIAGYNCKKAWIITDKIIRKDSLAVWYTPEIKFANLASTGGLSGMSALGNFGGVNNFSKVDGFIMQYDQDMPRGRKMEVKVTKIETDKEIADKEFEVPKDIEIKSIKEMNNGQGGMRIMTRP
jgi:GLPGLI family protein